MAALDYRLRLVVRPSWARMAVLVLVLLCPWRSGCPCARAAEPAPLQSGTLLEGGRTLHYVSAGADTLPLVLLIHGSPGSWAVYRALLTDSDLTQRAHLVAVDRPGFGASEAGRAEISLQTQAALLAPLLQLNHSAHPPIVVGYSFGGAVALRLALDYPQRVGCLVLVASPVDPALEHPEWYRPLGALPLLRALLPAELAVSNQEILALKTQLRQMVPRLPRLRTPTTFVQGEHDRIVLPANVRFGKQALPNARVDVVTVPRLNHAVLKHRPDLVRAAILRYLHQPE